MAFNITSNVLGALNTISNMQTAKTTQQEAEFAKADRAKQEQFRNEQLQSITSTGQSQLDTLNAINEKITPKNRPTKPHNIRTGATGFESGMSPDQRATQSLMEQTANKLRNNRNTVSYMDFVRRGAPTYYFDEQGDPVYLDTKTGQEIKKPTEPGGNNNEQ